MNKEYSRENIERVKSFLEKELWEYHFIELLSLFEFDVYVAELNASLHYMIETYQNFMTMTVSLPLKHCDSVKESSNSSVYELANSINRELNIGSFYINPKECSVCFKMVHSTKNRLFTEEDIKDDVYYGTSKVQCYARGFELVNSGVSIQDALSACRSRLISTVYRILIKNGSPSM